MDEIEQVQPTPEQLMKELEAWLTERNAVIVPVAVGRKTGQLCNIIEWEPDSHAFSYAVLPKGQAK